MTGYLPKQKQLMSVLFAALFLIEQSNAQPADGGWINPLDDSGNEEINQGINFQFRTKPVHGHHLHVEVLHPTHVRNYLFSLKTGETTWLGSGKMTFRSPQDGILVVGRSAFWDTGGRFWYDVVIGYDGVPLKAVSGHSLSCRPAEGYPKPVRQLIEESDSESFCES